ncbi:BREX-3 system P-loop-containing protein BrxF [Chloroflexota bacterium]
MDSLQAYFLLDHKPNLTIGLNLSIAMLQEDANWIVSEYQLHSIALNKELSQLLIRKQQSDYSKEIIYWVSQRINDIEEEPILLSDIEILFEPSFKLDPLVIFKQASRNKKLLVLWPGEFRNNKLGYAIPEHAHYRYWIDPGVEIIHV